MIDWVDSNNLTFAVRCGGHSYEGFSQSSDVVIDLRGMADIAVDKAANLVTVGGGASLFHIYQALAAQGLALQAGSCPTVGIAGHIMGGGHGLLARSHGLTCDAIQQVTVVDSQSRILTGRHRNRICTGPARAAAAAALASPPSSSCACFRSQPRLCSACPGNCRSRMPQKSSQAGSAGRRTRRQRSRRS
jgi:FAD/FMN-containing dehydrogenase